MKILKLSMKFDPFKLFSEMDRWHLVTFTNGHRYIGPLRECLSVFRSLYPEITIPVFSATEYNPRSHCTTTYECEICHGVNSSARYTCQYCGTIPTSYSILRKLCRIVIDEFGSIITFVPVYIAHGAMRQTSTRTIKRAIRTVPADYYAPLTF